MSTTTVSRREQILAVASELFFERGYHGTGIDQIGEAAGVTGPAVYRHFSGKQEVLDAVLLRGYEHVLKDANTTTEKRQSPKLALKSLVQARVEFALGPDRHIVAVFRTEEHNASAQCRRRVAAMREAYIDTWL